MTRHTPAVIVGLVVGLALGLLYTWVISPVKYVDTAPASLRADYRAEYLQMVARAFAVDQDIERARRRVTALGAGDPVETVKTFARQFGAAGGDPATLAALASLADALGLSPPTPPRSTSTAAAQPTLAPSVIPPATPRPLPTRAPTPTLVGTFQFAAQTVVCPSEADARLIQVNTLNAAGQPVSGVEMIVEWSGGLDHFFTGLKPEVSPGYGDYTMITGEVYTVYPANSPAAAVGNLDVPFCADGAPGSWRLDFKQP